jgi:uncharacterized membrane protein
MTAVATGVRDSRSPRWLVPVLVGSLALNLVVIGATGSLIWRSYFQAGEARLGRRVVPSVLGYAVTLPPARVKELEQLTKEEWRKVRPLRRALVAARDEVNKALTAEPFDQARFLAAQVRMIEADRSSREAAFKLHAAISLHLTPEERRGFLPWREKQRRVQNPLERPERLSGEPRR